MRMNVEKDEEATKKLIDMRKAMLHIMVDLHETCKELDRAYDELKVLDKMKSDFLDIVSHELKTPLTIVKSYCELIHDGMLGKVNEIQKEKLDAVIQETEGLLKLIADMLDLSAIEAGKFEVKMERLYIGEIIERAVKDMMPLAEEKKQQIIFHLPDELPVITGDNDRIKHVFHNLIENAVKYTPERGEIKIEANEDGRYLHVTVSDNGPGIPANELGRIFDKFYQVGGHLSRKEEGMGLGQAICKGFIEAHHGKIWAESDRRGNKFHFTLPKEI
jgi:hypothetical protein